MINERIKQLQTLMKKNKIDIYYIPTSDYHESEYVNEYFACRKYMSGFTGSAGIMVITSNEALLWADGRYYIQAANQIKGSKIKFMKWGDAKVLTPFGYIKKIMKKGMCIGFDGKVVNTSSAKYFENLVTSNSGSLKTNLDLVGQIWNDRPSLPNDKLFVLPKKYTGLTYANKKQLVLKRMRALNADYHLITTLDDIAYFLNLRGNDIKATPVFLSYLLINKTTVTLYLDQNKLTKSVNKYLSDNKIKVKDYNDVYSDVKKLNKGVMLLDKEKVNYTLTSSLKKSIRIINAINPTTLMKEVKNDTELNNLRIAHLKDGIAVTKFMYYLKNNISKEKMDEVSVGLYIDQLRKEQKALEPSFTTIAAYNDNAAMMHYSANKNQNSVLKAKGMLLVDSGGQYKEGTTDITRTFSLGKTSKEEKTSFTLVLKGFIALSKACFLDGCSGLNLDILARNHLWQQGIDYKCGTGHGVGYLLGVHEGPHGIKWIKSNGRHEDTTLKPGMVVTNEPGIYLEGKYGIRTENMMAVKEYVNNEFGQFYNFETLTYVPIDLDLIDKKYLDENEVEWLNEYHQLVYQKISPYLTSKEKIWLKKYTRKI